MREREREGFFFRGAAFARIRVGRGRSLSRVHGHHAFTNAGQRTRPEKTFLSRVKEEDPDDSNQRYWPRIGIRLKDPIRNRRPSCAVQKTTRNVFSSEKLGAERTFARVQDRPSSPRMPVGSLRRFRTAVLCDEAEAGQSGAER